MARGIVSLHRDWYHAPGSDLRRFLSRAGMPDECLDMVGEVVKKCSSCRKWDIKPIRPIARMSLSENFGDMVFFDILFYHRVNDPNRQVM